MDTIFKALAQALLSEGPLGVIIAGMAWWIWRQQNLLNMVQERRVEDALKIANAAHNFAGALDRNTEALKAFVPEE